MTTYVDYHVSPLHQGPRSRTGDQVDRQLVHDLLAVLGDCRLLWLPDLADTTTSTERGRHAGTITWSESLGSWDATRARLGAGVAVAFNGTDEEGDVPDAGRYSFGDGAADQPFSIVALIKPDANDALMTIVGKLDSAAAEEWELSLSASGHPQLVLTDESAAATLAGRDAAAAGTGWVLLAATYDGSRAASGLRLYKDAANRTLTDDSSGAYTAMENTAASVHLGARYATKERFFDGSIALVAVTAKALGTDDVWAVKEVVNSYFGLSL
ncbi:MAG: hypothetical protein J4N29_05065 [Chloroflexi bacterium]|nr:hypothetical protein [Chloroflexota bacterium]MCI0778993.1 hypothetical protein [Chloroflexota bacterium]MCI0816400.1 hypothetical protein [Chloroflexota bacterium]